MKSLEDNPVFAAGHGSCLNKAGEVEMDSIITDGGEFAVHSSMGQYSFTIQGL